ncbi:hypothetical protein BKA70DRAFT_1293896 [Coprinopsis sp. MPI-PUGE-AT-0042]|nr:hypothetical protein BKA70DRAFT_1293896 [Coprinopsis sp. MPI-PUGE-AT-0042]
MWNIFIQVIRTSSRLAANVKKIYLEVFGSPNADSYILTLFVNVVPILPRLEALIVDSSGDCSDISALSPEFGIWYSPPQSTTFPSVHTIHLSGMKKLPLPLFERFPNLTTMVWADVESPQAAPLVDEPPFTFPKTFMFQPQDLPFFGPSLLYAQITTLESTQDLIYRSCAICFWRFHMIHQSLNTKLDRRRLSLRLYHNSYSVSRLPCATAVCAQITSIQPNLMQ